MYIGKFASLTGTTPKTIRFYESIGILPEPLRKRKYRIYDKTYIETVIQIKKAQDLGFKLAEIKSHMDDANIKKGLPASVIVNAITAKRNQIKLDIDKLQQLDTQMLELQKELEKSKCNLDSTL
ncbi:MAG: transcriptional regulator [Kangiella sp.]|nr:MAG: transcriptional regulator [Kangiella sp.]